VCEGKPNPSCGLAGLVRPPAGRRCRKQAFIGG